MSLSPETAVGGGEIMLFGVRVKVDPMRKSVSMNNLSEYEPPSNLGGKDLPEAAKDGGAASGYVSADDAAPLPSGGGSDRKRGTPWTEEEHKLFLIGLQKNGRGDWRGISRTYVKTRTPTQVASHAQKYYLRMMNLNRRRRRSSLFDITTDSVAAMPMEEARNRQKIAAQPAAQPASVPVPVPVPIMPVPVPIMPVPVPMPSNVSRFSTVSFPMTVGPVLVSMQGGNPLENSAMAQNFMVNGSSSMLVHHVPVLSMPPSSAMADLNVNEQVRLDPSLRLSLSTGQNQSAFQVVSSYRNGDRFVSVA